MRIRCSAIEVGYGWQRCVQPIVRGLYKLTTAKAIEPTSPSMWWDVFFIDTEGQEEDSEEATDAGENEAEDAGGDAGAVSDSSEGSNGGSDDEQ